MPALSMKMNRDDWGEWECPVCMDGKKKYNDPDAIRATVCDNGHVILLGPVKDGWRWAEQYVDA
jgi:hypothetical protein